jgi:uncharacterized protein YaiL (DUF2058 family)
MPETPIAVEVVCSGPGKGQVVERPLTAEEIAQREADRIAAELEQAERDRLEQERLAAEAEKEANIAKVPVLEAAVDDLIVAVAQP